MTASSVLARLKLGVRAGIAHCGGIDGAAATAERQRSVTGDWNNLNRATFPPLDCAFALDEASVAAGARAEILHRYAAELGHAAIPLPDLAGGCEALGDALAEVTADVGDAARDIVEAHRHGGDLTDAERAALVTDCDRLACHVQRLRLLAAGSVVVPLAERERA